MSKRKNQKASVKAQGNIVLPKNISSRLGFVPGSSVPVTELSNAILLRRTPASIAKIYIEPTSRCNLSCRICIRNTWEEQQGDMALDTFHNILQSLKKIRPKPLVVFGGLGEPLAHPDILDMLDQAKRHAASVELITNGMLLDEKAAQRMVAIGVDVVWLSIDGARPESYADMRIGAALPQVLDYAARLRDLRAGGKPHIGIVFVAMRRNIAELPDVVHIAHRLAADRLLITNVIPYTEDMVEEMLCADTLSMPPYTIPSPLAPQIIFPRIDFNNLTIQPLYQVIRTIAPSNLGDSNLTPNHCPFIESGSCCIAWDGSISPCLPLLHTHVTFLNNRRRVSYRCTLGNINSIPLETVWNCSKYLSFRKRVQRFPFSQCTMCGGCNLSKTNEEDCLGNPFPTCGGCLWAQGVVRCP